MSKLESDFMPEVERYELFSGPAYHFTPDRRDFLKTLGGGILVLLALSPAEISAQESGGGRRGGGRGGAEMPQTLGAWLHLRPDGGVTVFTGKVEVGQNARTSLTSVVAEELRLDRSRIEMVMADTELTPYDMGTVGSMTTPRMAPQIHKVAAVAREMLIDLAARQWKVDRAGLTLGNGAVHSASGQTLTFAELSRGQELTRTISSDAPITAPADWKVLGHDLTKVNARDMVTGRHRYTHDMVRPGMIYGRVIRPPAFGAKLQSVDSAGVDRIAGVTVVHDGDFLGIASADSSKLAEAASAIKAQWSTPSTEANSRELSSYLKAHTRGAVQPSSDVAEALKSADGKVEATYHIPYIAHTPLETRAAVAEWNGDKLTVWTGSQRPFGVRDEVAQAFNMSAANVRVIVPDTGSGYGGKHTGEAAIEAARLAKAAGKPVKVAWSREEEFTWAYFRPGGVIDVRSGARKDGTIVAWEFHNYNSGGSGLESPYNIPGQKCQYHATESPLRQGSYRGLAATANHFAREVHMDELAASIGMEPLAFRLKNAGNPRLRAVIEAAAERFAWGKTKSSTTQGFGMSAGFEKGGFVACCVEVRIDPASKQINVVRVVESFECGAVLNPLQLKNQIEGSIMMGIGGALIEAIQFENGRILNASLGKYHVPRFSDAPAIDVVLVDRKDIQAAGAGETPIVGIAPAIGNAVFRATGQRLRSLPMKPA
jgi:CO/xanthine dehydrogenase Mo-binding subunit